MKIRVFAFLFIVLMLIAALEYRKKLQIDMAERVFNRLALTNQGVDYVKENLRHNNIDNEQYDSSNMVDMQQFEDSCQEMISSVIIGSYKTESLLGLTSTEIIALYGFDKNGKLVCHEISKHYTGM